MQITIGVFAHVDAGKTTFAEQLLYHTQSIRQRGRVDHKDAFLDSHEIERARGITVFADQAVFTYRNNTYYMIDTPGHVDFSPEMERAIQVLDYAILIVSAVEGVQGHTETVWQLLHKHRVPTFFFLNKTDRTGADMEKALADIRTHLTPDVCLITGQFEEGRIGDSLLEQLAERDERLLESYLEGAADYMLGLQAMQGMVNAHRLFPCACGSALQDVGITDFLDQLHLLADTKYDEQAPFGGRVYKIRHDENGNRLTFTKAISGKLRLRDELCYGYEEDRVCEKVTQLRLYNGSKYQAIDEVRAGALFAVAGLSGAAVGQGLGVYQEKAEFEMVPTMQAKVIFDPPWNVKEVLQAFRILDAEDPSLAVVWEETVQEIHIHVMGLIQLEVLQQLVQERFGINVRFGAPEILYKETILSTVNGYGHFEPLKHYAEVHLRLEPGERGSGLVFENACHADDLSVGNQNLVRTHLFERDHHGLLTGSPLTDVKVTLLTGRAHNKHTHGGDFREATFRALRQGLEKADNILLEPYYQFKIKVELDHLGRVLSDIQQAAGQFDPPETVGNQAVITGRAPVATMMQYAAELAAITHGKGAFHATFGGYDRCHNEQEVIERKGYRKDADPLYTSSSIFCAKGVGYTVPWDEAEAKMHLL
ncbi:tetracycline resistance protein [Xylanibacillus composti]|uniref:Tetracycline resistance protein n=1 Tax=Xylanibacillus composti TaxID=1572762 RepID=A0A8J4H4X7_9BACL|nr:tetracycline resistance protein [Xylanibacillus composti]